MWPFGKKKDAPEDVPSTGDDRIGHHGHRDSHDGGAGTPAPATDTGRSDGPSPADPADSADSADDVFDPVNGSFGPFDGDSVDYREFDFSDFAKGGLDLGSMMVPVPHSAEVQVEMGPDGPRQIHILTPHGRITPAAFAAPRSGGQWAGDIDEFAEGMVRDGLTVTRRRNDWGEELVGTVGDGVVRVIGVDGPRWMLRMTLAGPAAAADDLAELAYEVVSRSFVNRGSEPAPAGRALPVRIPQAMADELQRAIDEQAAQRQAAVRDGQPGQAGQAAQQAPQGQPGPAAGSPVTPARRRSGGTVGRQMEDSE